MKNQELKNIRLFIVEELGKLKGEEINNLTNQRLILLINNLQNKNKAQIKTAKKIILPRIALYLVLKEMYNQNVALDILEKYMKNIIGKKKYQEYLRLEKIPFFYSLYQRIFLTVMRKTSLYKSTQKHDKTSFNVTIKQCLWFSLCEENDCKELCQHFCAVDDITYGNLKKIGFARSKSLGYGGDCCDFHFFKK